MEKATKNILYGLIISLIATICGGLWVILVIEAKYENVFYLYGHGIQVIYPCVYIICLFYGLLSPISCAAELVICQLINGLTDLFEEWIDLLKRRQTKYHAN